MPITRGEAAAHRSEQGRAAHRHPKTLRQSRATGAAERQTDVTLVLGQARGASRRGGRHVGHRLGEYVVRTLLRPAAEPARDDCDGHRASLPRQIAQPSPIPAMHPGR